MKKLRGGTKPVSAPVSYVGVGLGRAATGLASLRKGLKASQSGGKKPGAFKPSKKGPPV